MRPLQSQESTLVARDTAVMETFSLLTGGMVIHFPKLTGLHPKILCASWCKLYHNLNIYHCWDREETCGCQQWGRGGKDWEFGISKSKYREGFPCSSVGKESAFSAGDPGSIPGLGRSPVEGNGNPLQDPCLENLRDRGAWWAAVHGVTKSRAWLSN